MSSSDNSGHGCCLIVHSQLLTTHDLHHCVERAREQRETRRGRQGDREREGGLIGSLRVQTALTTEASIRFPGKHWRHTVIQNKSWRGSREGEAVQIIHPYAQSTRALARAGLVCVRKQFERYRRKSWTSKEPRRRHIQILSMCLCSHYNMFSAKQMMPRMNHRQVHCQVGFHIHTQKNCFGTLMNCSKNTENCGNEEGVTNVSENISHSGFSCCGDNLSKVFHPAAFTVCSW